MDTDNLIHEMNVEDQLPEENGEAEPPRSSRKDGKNKKKKKAKGCLITLIIFMVVVVAAAFLARASLNYVKNFNEAVDPEDESTIDFTIKKEQLPLILPGFWNTKVSSMMRMYSFTNPSLWDMTASIRQGISDFLLP